MIVGREIEGDDFHQGRENAGHGLQPTYFRVFDAVPLPPGSKKKHRSSRDCSSSPGMRNVGAAWLGTLANCGQLWPRLGNAQDRARQLGLFGLAGEASRSGGAQAAPCALSQENKLLEGRPVPGSDISVALPLSLSLSLSLCCSSSGTYVSLQS